ncbi:patatin-like protein 1 [Geobacter sp. OR-1]|uniref:patatin-like phospholipase family protein n=1 Tax=Geobacter sp. OR-1 TaxID=1266765 RepID=UPI000542824C|nr:patatin-like phospholipase family protein [Geobacter sp. OR-1]GAM11192.1 patatin-like protein 1 [Geobacter sp. OR-1]
MGVKPVASGNTTSQKYFRILSIDGGGIRGIIPAAVLTKVEEAIRSKTNDNNLKIGDCFDMIAGTSTGGILTCVYLAPDTANPAKARFSAKDALNLYMQNGDEIFDRSAWKRIVSLGGLADEKYSAEMLEKTLKNYFGDLELCQLIQPCLITAYNTKRYESFFYTQHDAKIKPERNFLVRDVARATSAAPTYFEMALSESLDNIPNAAPMIDGGVFANNPAACALVEALRLHKVAPTTENMLPLEISNVAILSLGTGKKTASISYKEGKDWGLAGWAKPLISILMDGVAQTVTYQVETVFESIGVKNQFLRIDGEFGDYKNNLDIEGIDSSMDNASTDNMRRLERFGQQLAQNYRTQIDDFVTNYLLS